MKLKFEQKLIQQESQFLYHCLPCLSFLAEEEITVPQLPWVTPSVNRHIAENDILTKCRKPS
jgi:hypothetical protein